MKYVPHDYQAYATDFILAHPEAAVLLDMGLGKSVITLTAIQELCLDAFEISRVLVVSRESKTDSLFDQTISTFDDDGGAYNQADAGGFIKLNALRMRIAGNKAAARRPGKKKAK